MKLKRVKQDLVCLMCLLVCNGCISSHNRKTSNNDYVDSYYCREPNAYEKMFDGINGISPVERYVLIAEECEKKRTSGKMDLGLLMTDISSSKSQTLSIPEKKKNSKEVSDVSPIGSNKLFDSLNKSKVNFSQYGNYHALLIGNGKYPDSGLNNLPSTKRDVEAIQTILEDDYGFDVEPLIDASREKILKALKRYRSQLSPDDNLLIYYAGHGAMDPDTKRGYWLPVDAEADNTAGWLSSDDIGNALKAMKAKHVLVVADSCYSGAIATRSMVQPVTKSEDYSRLAKKRTRLALTSGALEPVLDNSGNGHSLFANVFMKALTDNDEPVLEAEALFVHLRKRVMLDSEQTPVYAPIPNTGHDFGDFLFVKQRN